MTAQPDTLRGAVDLPLTPVRHQLDGDQLRAKTSRVSPIQLAPEPQPVTTRPSTGRLLVSRSRTPIDVPSHGISGYNRGCGCDVCRAGKAAANRRQRGATR